MTLMQIAGIALMVLGFAGLIFCTKRQATNPAMQPLALVLFVAVVGGAFMMLSDLFKSGDDDLRDNELFFSYSRGYVIGQKAAENYKGKKVLFVTDDMGKGKDLPGIVKAFQQGFGGPVVMDCPAVSKDLEKSGMTIEEAMQPPDFDAMLAKHPDVAVVVSAIGLPKNAERMSYFSQSAAQRPALYLLSSGEFFGRKRLDFLKNGAIRAIVIANPAAKYDVKAPKDPAEAFPIRYLLISKDNVSRYEKMLR